MTYDIRMLKRSTIILGLSLSGACSKSVTHEQHVFLDSVKTELAVNASILADEADSHDLSYLDFPIESMELGSNPSFLMQEEVRMRIQALPDIVDQFDIKEQVKMVEPKRCGKTHGACVDRFNYSDIDQNEANIEDVIEEAKGRVVYIAEDQLNQSIWDYDNPEPIITPFETLPPEYDQAMALCLWVGILGHELFHTAGIGHNKEYDENPLVDPSYVFGLSLNVLCLEPYNEKYRDQ